jgi:S1-C subfamily serine protease
VIILAGTLHVDKGQGIEHRLRVLRPESRIAGIVPVRSIEEITADNTFSYFCPPTSSRIRLGIVAEMENAKIMVTGVVQGSLAMESGLVKGDQIVRANEKEVSSLADLHAAAVEALEDDHDLRLEVLRNGRLEVFEILF